MVRVEGDQRTVEVTLYDKKGMPLVVVSDGDVVGPNQGREDAVVLSGGLPEKPREFYTLNSSEGVIVIGRKPVRNLLKPLLLGRGSR